MILGDDVIDANPPALKQMIDVYQRVDGPVLAVERVPVDDVSSYGVVEDRRIGRQSRTRRLPHHGSRREAAPRGCAVEPGDHRPLHPDARHLSVADRDGQRSHGRDPAHQRAAPPAEGSRPIYAYEIDGVRHDTGNKLGFLKALVYFALRRPILPSRSASISKRCLTPASLDVVGFERGRAARGLPRVARAAAVAGLASWRRSVVASLFVVPAVGLACPTSRCRRSCPRARVATSPTSLSARSR